MSNDIGTQARRTAPSPRRIASPYFNGFPVHDKSINSTNSVLEADSDGFTRRYNAAVAHSNFAREFNRDYYANNAPASGITSQETPETAIRNNS